LLAVTRSVVYAQIKRRQDEDNGLECIFLSLVDEDTPGTPFSVLGG